MRTSEAPLILSVDTATEKRSVAVLRGTRPLSLSVGDARSSSSSEVLADIDRALREASIGVGDIDLFAAAVGPGSFTGLRSGLATLKAFSATLEKPIVGIPTLHALAYAAGRGERVAALIPAGRGEVFAQFLGVTADGSIVEHEASTHIRMSALIAKALDTAGELKWAAMGGDAFVNQLVEEARRAGVEFVNAVFPDREQGVSEWTLARPVESLAEVIGVLALESFRRGVGEGAEGLHAMYVRASDAELKEQCPEQG
ncbi:MAG TPA: tRNA (adenosine(37)-N6)-threonylcarbamoyltransferase complex dimerization subunit type 1 TsaB [Pyrinomonadaceae bacterium]|nr:tRNA (adenosine(37)-N6)-threonylcarbamoyltransferase complex dimerization subunit type 1 TsaB [Pyrinomonadaceae bacterium]